MKYKMIKKENIFGSTDFENGKIYEGYIEKGQLYLLDGTEKKGQSGLIIYKDELKFLEEVKGEK